VPVAVNDYSPQKCRCKPGACLVSAGVPLALSRLHCPPPPWAMAGRCAGG